MKMAYFDCFSGASGDMVLGALLDAGLPFKTLEENLRRALSGLPSKAYTLKTRKVTKGHIRATKVEVLTHSPPTHLKTLADLEKAFQKSRLKEMVRQKGLKVLKRLIEAEAKVHGTTPARLSPHGMDPVDTLVDITGAVLGLDLLKIRQVVASPIQVGSGLNGLAPATAEMLKGVPVYSSGIPRELTTPTGAALISTLAEDFSPTPPMILEAVGYGAGTWNLEQQPNVLRLLIGTPLLSGRPYETDRVVEMETHIDDLSPQVYEHLMERLFSAGALDVALTAIVMKKGRPGTRINVIADDRNVPDLLHLLFSETTTLGVRMREAVRAVLSRVQREVPTRFGKISVKVIAREGNVPEILPEYESCRKIARQTGRPLRTVMAELREEVRNEGRKDVRRIGKRGRSRRPK